MEDKDLVVLIIVALATLFAWWGVAREHKARVKQLAGRESLPVALLVAQLPLAESAQESAEKLWNEIARGLRVDAGLLRPDDRLGALIGPDATFTGDACLEVEVRLQKEAPHVRGAAVTVGDVVVALARSGPDSPRR